MVLGAVYDLDMNDVVYKKKAAAAADTPLVIWISVCEWDGV